ncbi:hypothetical protein GCM10010272_69180 [Streptomyces lateritius]|nr:hypothetical protein GCM10010272_69180 [Streptomyces lateritius]
MRRLRCVPALGSCPQPLEPGPQRAASLRQDKVSSTGQPPGEGHFTPGRMLTAMIHPVSGPPTWRHPVSALALASLIGLCWYATRPVYADCVYFGNYSIQEAVESGQCDPPQMRWRTWAG